MVLRRKIALTFLVLGLILPLVSLFLPFSVTNNYYFDEENGGIIDQGYEFASGMSWFFVIIANYICMGIIIASGYTGRTIANRILIIFFTVIAIPVYSFAGGFLTHDWSATNSRHTSFTTGCSVMLMGNLFIVIGGLLVCFRKKDPAKIPANSGLIDDQSI